jgi:glycosyltransferase involved in cell wall biosynthesis
MAAEPLRLSLIVPAFNCAGYIAEHVGRITATLEHEGWPFEVLVVCDGSTDGTAAAADSGGDPRVRVIRCDENGGKGAAIVHGLSVARGALIGWLDADLDISPDAICRAARLFDQRPIDGALGSKRHPDSRVHYPLVRRLYSIGYQQITRALFRVGVRDTQVGAKVFRREVADTIAPLLLVKRYAFDLEFLAVSVQFGFDRFEEVPVDLGRRVFGSSVNWQGVWKTLIDTVAVAYRIHVRHWYVRQFAAQQRRRLDQSAPELPSQA